MQLGAILDAGDDEPLLGRDVEFRIKKQTGKGQRLVRVKARLLPVGEADRQQSKRDALVYLRTAAGSPYRKPEKPKDGPEAAIPADVLGEERSYQLLKYALHDADDTSVRFVGAADYERFRQGLTVEQVNWLHREYEALIEEQYPETLTPERRRELAAQLAEQAAGK